MPWITRGLRNGVLTTGWPARRDEYFDEFPAVVDMNAAASPQTADTAARVCPTRAITVEPTPRLDRGRCILCGRCVEAAPEAFFWQRGSDSAVLSRQALVVGDTGGLDGETDTAVAELRTQLRRRVRRLRHSVHIRHVDAGSDGSDEWEVAALLNPVYDIHRLGIFFTASPRHADILLVTGIGATAMVEPLRRTLDAMPNPIVVIAAGADALSGGLIGGGYAGGTGIDDLVGVDVWVPGAPPSPFSLLHAILLALGRVDPAGGRSQ